MYLCICEGIYTSACVSFSPSLSKTWSASAEFVPLPFTRLFLGPSVGNREKLITKAHVLPCENVKGTLEPWCKTKTAGIQKAGSIEAGSIKAVSVCVKRSQTLWRLLGANDTFKEALQWLEPARLGLTRSNINVLLLCDICAFPHSLLELLKAHAPIWKWNKQHKSDCGCFRSRVICQK